MKPYMEAELKAFEEVARRLALYDKMLPLVTELAEWDATTDSWFLLFDNYRKRAREILKK
jgi:hypothetical protein